MINVKIGEVRLSDEIGEGEGVEFFLFLSQFLLLQLGATSIDKIGEVRLSDEIGEGGVWNFEKKTELYKYY